MADTTVIPTSTSNKPLDPTKVRSYIGYFLHQNRRTEPKLKMFEYKGLLKDAIREFYTHCQIMGYRFISVRPFMVDLKEQEERKVSDPDYKDDFAD